MGFIIGATTEGKQTRPNQRTNEIKFTAAIVAIGVVVANASPVIVGRY